DLEGAGRLARNLAHFARAQALDALDEMGPVGNAVVGDGRDRMRKLDRGEGVVALADAGGYAVALIPLAMLFPVVGAGKTLALPVTRRQHALELAVDVDAGLAAEAELRHEPVSVVDVGLAAEDVVIRVAGRDDRFVHVDGAVTALLVVHEAVRRARER